MSAAARRRHRWGRRPLVAAALIGVVLAIDGSAQRQVLAAPAGARQLAAFLSGGALVAARDLLRPGSGEQDLPGDVLAMLALVRGHDVQAFSVSPRITEDTLWLQRLTEAAFPRRIVKHAEDRLVLVGEALPIGCQPVAATHGVLLVRCA